MNINETRADRPNHQAYDEVRIITKPRYKESYLSGDEWRISAVIQFYLKGILIGERGYNRVATALQYGDWGAIEIFEGAVGREPCKIPDVSAYCDQEGCSELATHKFMLKKRYRNDGSVKDMVYPQYRCFCDRHKHRGDCGLDDADKNYQEVEFSK